MAITNRDRVARALETLREGLAPFVERELRARLGDSWQARIQEGRQYPLKQDLEGKIAWDSQALLKVMVDNWMGVFKFTLGHADRSFTSELLDVRNRFAHEEPFNSDDALRAIDTGQRLLMSISARKSAEELEKAKAELMRTVYAEQARKQTRGKTLTLEGAPKAGLKPWREVITPHPDVAGGTFKQAEFAADLAQVYRGEGEDEYLDPVEFYRRTYLTEGLGALLNGAIMRLAGTGGDPVVELQTNFGGGKTHSMLALYHMAKSGHDKVLPGLEELMREAGVEKLRQANVAVLVGTALSAAETHEKPDGTVTRTLWGEMAWQLGGKDGYAMVRESDEKGVSPGSNLLTELLNRYAPCLVLIDEWVAFFRGIYSASDLPAGSFETNLTFAQALTEAARASKQAMLVATLPASQIEIGGEGGQAALDRLKNTFSRIESPWRPANQQESYEIVRRRLFEPMTEKESFAARDAVIKAFGDMYRGATAEFPHGCDGGDYRRWLEASYPIHPELFERLYNDWASLDKFQRTRGVLRLMAAIIRVLWERNDSGLLILPASVPLDDRAVEAEIAKYLDDGWTAVISNDVDGEASVPLTIDREIPNLGRYSATRRVARALFVGSAPTSDQGQNPGIDDRRIRLGCAQPGESPATFGDALRRLADRATYLYQDGARHWFSTKPSVARLADERASTFDAEDVDLKIVEALKKIVGRSDFAGVHTAPDGSGDVPDDKSARLLVLGPAYPHVKNGDSRAITAAREILDSRGTGQRLYRNMLVFAAPDAGGLDNLRQAMQMLTAWTSIADEWESLNLDAFQKKQSESRRDEFQKTVETRLKDTWIWALTPSQPDAKDPGIEWTASRVAGQEPLAERVARKLSQDEALLSRMGPARLKMALDNYSLWGEADHLNTAKLWDYLASYLYLPRLRDEGVLAGAIQAAVDDLANEHFGYAARYDEEHGRYEGLKLTGGGSVIVDSLSVVVKPAAAKAQLEKEAEGRPGPGGAPVPGPGGPETPVPGPEGPTVPGLPTRFFASVELDPDRAGRDMGRIAEEVLQHLTTQPKARVKLSLEIEAEIPDGAPEDMQRVVTENSQTLKFKQQGFEKE